MINEKTEKLKAYLEDAAAVVFFGGAGVSTESGIPDFRGVDGLYRQKYAYPPEQILSHTFFMENPKEFYRFYRDKILISGVKPNKAHLALARLERQGKLKAIVTQNIDTLHQDAGSRVVYQIHGTVQTNHCVRCGKAFSVDDIRSTDGVPVCDACGDTIKPDVVLYEEALPDYEWSSSVRAISEADLLIIGGTSLTVYPAASLIRYMKPGAKLVLINRDATPMDREADLVIHESIGEVLDAVIGKD